MEPPICLIENRDNFIVNPRAIDILSTINQPVVVVAIVGPYRTGKSYLMNKLAGNPKGFVTGYTVQAMTKGIWMWCVPHPIKENHTLVLLDTEGLGDVGKGDSKNDIWLFALSVLLSSALVYNSKGNIDQTGIDKLKYVADITDLIKVRSNSKNDEGELSRHFPMFVWAVRDFHLELKIGGKPVSEDEYLESALNPKNSANTTKEQDFNKVTDCLRMYFGKRKCFVFGLPSCDTEKLQTLEDVPEKNLNGKFLAQCQKFCDYIFNNVDVKKMAEIFTVTGKQFGELAKMYTEAINSSNFACIESTAMTLSDRENKAAIEEAMQHYENMMKTVVLPTETLEHFLQFSKQYEAEAMEIFQEKSLRGKNKRFLEQLLVIFAL
ncbi:guanylate-binding protein 6-like [Hyperolius riggenbachi]|uniref:guanylate-binding protein 6-like n=1 Tax=Hyperolius riggenbachi TaxID=752182 RepID=UPI0035A3BBA1